MNEWHRPSTLTVRIFYWLKRRTSTFPCCRADSANLRTMEEELPFDIISHTIPVFPFRQYPQAILDEQKDLYLSVKQYVPRNSKDSTSFATDPVTIVAAGGLGFIKELYEPLFVELLSPARSTTLSIRSIWIADMFNTGQSAVENQHNLGCDPAWMDHVRDLWCVINHFQKEIIKPVVGLGHSMGCNQLLYLSHWHPGLFNSFAFIEAGIDPEYGKGITIPWMLQTLKRKEAFPTRKEAEADLVKAHFAAGWDERVKLRLKKYGIYRVDVGGRMEWRSTTPKQQIATLVSRFNPERIGLGPGGINAVTLKEREAVPDSDPAAWNEGPFYRPELKGAWDILPNVRPWVLYVNAGKSPFFGRPDTREERARLTGTGIAGNGGMKLGAVQQVIVDEGEHTMVFDKNLNKIADHVAKWMVEEARRWSDGEQKRMDNWRAQSLVEKQTVSGEYVKALILQISDMKRKPRL